MKVLITGVAGFAGSSIARAFREQQGEKALSLFGIDNFSRSGSEVNRPALRDLGVKLYHGDIRRVILSNWGQSIGSSMQRQIPPFSRASMGERAAVSSSSTIFSARSTNSNFAKKSEPVFCC